MTPTAPPNAHRDWAHHHTSYLRQIGFRSIERVQEFGIFDDTSSLRIDEQLISVNVEARNDDSPEAALLRVFYIA
jgi:hypothetical protein